jgi:hypothetical protein
MNKESLKHLKFVVLVGLIILMISCSGCSKTRIYEAMEYTDGEEYKTYTLSEGDIHFSFEYPVLDFFNGEAGGQIGRSDSTIGRGVAFGIPYNEKQPMVFFINYYRKDEKLTSVNAAVEERLAYVKEEVDVEVYTDYKLLKKRKIHVSGLNGIELMYSYSNEQNLGPNVGNSAMERVVFFSYGDIIWEVSYISDALIVDRANSELEHILQTFRILD